MTPAALLMLWVHDQITFDGYVWAMNQLYPVAATLPAHAYRPLAELAPTWAWNTQFEITIREKVAA